MCLCVCVGIMVIDLITLLARGVVIWPCVHYVIRGAVQLHRVNLSVKLYLNALPALYTYPYDNTRILQPILPVATYRSSAEFL